MFVINWPRDRNTCERAINMHWVLRCIHAVHLGRPFLIFLHEIQLPIPDGVGIVSGASSQNLK